MQWTMAEKIALKVLQKHNKIVYINQKGTGCGTLCLNHKRLVGLQEVEISAATNDLHVHFADVKLKISAQIADMKKIEGGVIDD